MEEDLIHIIVKKQSERLANKNTIPFANTTLLDIAITKSLKILPKEKVYLNTNCEKAIELAHKYNIKIYHRSEKLCKNDVTLDQINYDFILKHKPKNLILVNTVVPLLKSSYLHDMITMFKKKNYPSLISGNEFQLHSFCRSCPINFSQDGKIPPTQEIAPIEIINWGYGIWNSELAMRSYEKNNKRSVFLDGGGVFPTPILESIKISNKKDFEEAQRYYKFLIEEKYFE